MCTGNSVLGQVSVLDLTVSGRQAAQSCRAVRAAWPTRGRARWLEVPSNRPTKSITRSTKSIPIHHSQSSQSISIYRQGNWSKNQCLGFYFSISKAR